MKITLKKGSVGASSPAVVPESGTTPSGEASAETPAEMPASPDPEVSAPVHGPTHAVVGGRKRIDIYGIIFAVLGFFAIAVFVALLVMQGSEISFYKAPDSLWLK
jgi:hypothetical protein